MFRKVLTVLDNRIRLRKKSEEFAPHSQWSDQDKSDLKDLQDTFNVLQGHGLALPQIGIMKRGIVVNLQSLGLSGSEMQVMVNPVLEVSGEMIRSTEACFSVPHISAQVKRYESCTVSYTTLEGQEESLSLSGYASACLQHEVDHLDGVLYIDKAGRVYSGMLMKKCLKAEAKAQKEKEARRLEFERDRRGIYGLEQKKTTSSKKRSKKPRKKRPNRSKKKK